MSILLGFAPFVAFAMLSRFVSPSVSLCAAAAVSAAIILRQKIRGGSIKILEIGTFILFAALGIYASVRVSGWDIPIVRTVVDGGLLLIILFSMLFVARSLCNTLGNRFLRTCRVRQGSRNDTVTR
jgi:hypothetical protein